MFLRGWGGLGSAKLRSNFTHKNPGKIVSQRLGTTLFPVPAQSRDSGLPTSHVVSVPETSWEFPNVTTPPILFIIYLIKFFNLFLNQFWEKSRLSTLSTTQEFSRVVLPHHTFFASNGTGIEESCHSHGHSGSVLQSLLVLS